MRMKMKMKLAQNFFQKWVWVCFKLSRHLKNLLFYDTRRTVSMKKTISLPRYIQKNVMNEMNAATSA